LINYQADCLFKPSKKAKSDRMAYNLYLTEKAKTGGFKLAWVFLGCLKQKMKIFLKQNENMA